MTTPSTSSAHLPCPAGTLHPTPRGRGLLASLWRDIVGSWRHALARAGETGIDDATLRDLGLRRSELGSFAAEARGDAPATRLRTLMLHQRSFY